METMTKESWPGLVKGAERSLLILAPWTDEELIDELFSFLPAVDIRVLFPREVLKSKDRHEFRYELKGTADVNFNIRFRITDEPLPNCLVVDDQSFYYSETYSELLETLDVTDAESGIDMARRAWRQGEPWAAPEEGEPVPPGQTPPGEEGEAV